MPAEPAVGGRAAAPSAARTFRRTLALLGEYRRRAALAVLPGLGMAALNVAIPLLIGRTVDDALLRAGPRDVLVSAAALAGLAAARWLMAAWRRDACGRLGADLEYALRCRMWRVLLRSEPGGTSGPRPGDVLARLATDVRAVRTFLTWALVFIVINVAMFVLATAQMVLLSPRLALYVGATAPLLLAGTLIYNRRLLRLSRDLQSETGDLSARTEQLAAGIQTVKALGREGAESQGFASAARRVRDAGIATARIRATFEPLLAVLPQVALALVLWQGARLAADGRISVGTLLVFVSYLLMLAWPIKALGLLIGYSTGALAAAERVFEVLDRPPAVPDAAGARALPAPRAGAARLVLDGVTVAGPDGRMVLDGADLVLPAGSRTAVIGANGSGKSILARLLCRFRDPDGGRVLLDGVDLRTAALSSVRRSVVVLGPEPTIFPATARENLLAGLGTQASPAELARTLDLAEAGDMVDTWPDGLDTRLGEGGLTLSGGERQRLALARALMHRPTLLVIDEGLNHLDPVTEEKVLERVARAVPATILLVSSAPSALADLDAVYRLADGRLVEVHPSWASAAGPAVHDLRAS